MAAEVIEIRKVATHNLKAIDLDIPMAKWTVVTGVSGSGKSSLVFDTLYAESYGRFVESLSAYARQYMKALPRPQYESISHLPAAIAVRQQRGAAHPRSTVGSLTELSDVLRVIFAQLAEQHCPHGHGAVQTKTVLTVVEEARRRAGAGRLDVLAPLKAWQRLEAKKLVVQLKEQGFSRCEYQGEIYKLEQLALSKLHHSSLVIDRILKPQEEPERLTHSIAMALKAGAGQVMLRSLAEVWYANTNSACDSCGYVMKPLHPMDFNPHHPAGACAGCQGFGKVAQLDRQKIVPDLELSLVEEAVVCWRFGSHSKYLRQALSSAEACGVEPHMPLGQYNEQQWQWLFKGKQGTGFRGLEGYFKFLDRKKYKPALRIHAARFRSYVQCPECSGGRLGVRGRRAQLQGAGYQDWEAWPLEVLQQKLLGLEAVVRLVGHELEEAFGEARQRLAYLRDIGLDYLHLERRAQSLSGGELQRLHMARTLGSPLTGAMFCLDEPSVGLHPHEVQKLIQIIRQICDLGNTVVMVEHEQALIQAADHMIALGPQAGEQGGQLVYKGAPYCKKPQLLPGVTTAQPELFLTLHEARRHNLRGDTVRFALGSLNVVCGVSGSGKSTLVREAFYPRLAYELAGGAAKQGVAPEAVGWLEGPLSSLSRVLVLGQEPLSRSSRSNIGTFLGVLSEVRQIYAQLPKSKGLGLKPGDFSFNVAGGRCEDCKGLGTVIEELGFLGDVQVTCQSCQGRRFQAKVLSVTYEGYNLCDLLKLTVTEVYKLFRDRPRIKKCLNQVIELGMGYMTLGQETSRFSGGEAQRLKLLGVLKEVKSTQRYCIIIDEPTTGLSDHDIVGLLQQLRVLTTQGHTVITIDHHPDVIKDADWIIEMGPRGGHAGGQLIYAGPLAGLLGCSRSLTAPYLGGAVE